LLASLLRKRAMQAFLQFDMNPILSRANVENCSFTYAKPCSENRMGFVRSKNFANIIFGQFGLALPLSLGLTVFSISICGIYGVISQKEVPWVNAQSIVASVTDVFLRRYRPVHQGPHQPMTLPNLPSPAQ